MSTLFLQIAVSLDGYIEGPDQDLGFFVEDADLDPVATATLESIDGMVFGRRAHAAIATFWQQAAADPPPADPDLARQIILMRDLPKYVLTRSGAITEWENSRPVGTDDVAAIVQRSARPIAVFAGAATAQALLPITDELRLIQYPVVLGSGTRLFADDGPRLQLERMSAQEFGSGAVLTTDRVVRA